ncbi:hypothetical protein [Cystobacter ferrugineus]|uniref:Uncharacterized protein n=1 Tax=Cystobacter ferrugineus TaxID=83449 RepID=A0A1L9AV58_9BACT|nr:hypothetical protein [Cystobacter ferrugineus]OJH33874.1 hypothetical protein BON30_46540 [Cystobacter ferrugineus]
MTRLLVVCVLVGWGTDSAAQEEPWAAMLRASSPEDTELAERLQGQLSDLPVVLRVSPGPAPSTEAAEQWRTAVALAEQGPFRVVIWFHHEPEAIVVHVAEPATRRLLVRRVQVETHQRKGRSAAAEAAALIVRSALKALAAGSPVGDVVEELPEVPVPALEPSPSPPTPPPAPARAGWGVSVGWQSTLVGDGPLGQHGAQLGMGWEGARLRARVLLLASLPSPLSDEYTRVSLSRHGLGAGVDAAVVSTEHFRLGAGLEVGLAGHLRSTEALAPGVQASAPRLTPSVYGAPTLAARWRAGPVALEANLALDVLTTVPTLGYLQQGTFVVRNSLWRAQPRFGLAILLGAH